MKSIFFRIVIGGVLIYSGFMKAVAPAAEFAAMIQAYRLLPHVFVMPLAIGLPWFEMWIGTFLLFGYATRWTAALASGLFAVFIMALGSALLRHIDLTSCGCFGQDLLSPRWTIGLDVLLLAGSLFLALTARRTDRYSLDAWLEPK